MSKYTTLKNMIDEYRDRLNTILNNNKEMVRPEPYLDYLSRVSKALEEERLMPSDGRRLGIARGISDFDLLADDETLWSMAMKIDDFYKNMCRDIPPEMLME